MRVKIKLVNDIKEHIHNEKNFTKNHAEPIK